VKSHLRISKVGIDLKDGNCERGTYTTYLDRRLEKTPIIPQPIELKTPWGHWELLHDLIERFTALLTSSTSYSEGFHGIFGLPIKHTRRFIDFPIFYVFIYKS
jgi:hypothetical protein